MHAIGRLQTLNSAAIDMSQPLLLSLGAWFLSWSGSCHGQNLCHWANGACHTSWTSVLAGRTLMVSKSARISPNTQSSAKLSSTSFLDATRTSGALTCLSRAAASSGFRLLSASASGKLEAHAQAPDREWETRFWQWQCEAASEFDPLSHIHGQEEAPMAERRARRHAGQLKKQALCSICACFLSGGSGCR